MHHLRLALEGAGKPLFSGLGLVLKTQLVVAKGRVGKKHFCDTLKLVTGILVIGFRCWRRKLTEIALVHGGRWFYFPCYKI